MKFTVSYLLTLQMLRVYEYTCVLEIQVKQHTALALT